MRRYALAILAALLLFAIAFWPSQRLDWIVMREFFRAAEHAGLISSGGSFWGQIMGRNIPTHSEQMHFVARATGATIGYAPALIGSILAFNLIAHGRRRTYCGHCAKVLRNLAEPGCPHCGASL